MLDKSVVEKARQMYQSGYYTYAQIAETLDISRSSVYSFCKDLVKKKGRNSKESSGSTTVVAVHEQSSDDNAHEITNTCASVATIAKRPTLIVRLTVIAKMTCLNLALKMRALF